MPEIAGRSHLRAILPVIDQALAAGRGRRSRTSTRSPSRSRPGLIGSLLVGLSTAKALAFARGLPLVGVAPHRGPRLRGDDGATRGRRATRASRWSSPAATRRSTASTRRSSSSCLGDDARRRRRRGLRQGRLAARPPLSRAGRLDRAARGARATRARFDFPRYRVARRAAARFSFSGLKTAVLYHLRGQDAAGADAGARGDPATAPTSPPRSRRRWSTRWSSPTLRRGARARASSTVARRRRRGLQPAPARAHGRGRGAARPRAPSSPRPAYCTDNAAMIAGLGWHLLARGPHVAGSALDASPDARSRRATGTRRAVGCESREPGEPRPLGPRAVSERLLCDVRGGTLSRRRRAATPGELPVPRSRAHAARHAPRAALRARRGRLRRGQDARASSSRSRARSSSTTTACS